MFESGLLVCLIGFGMVFVVLAILILMIYAISWVTRRLVKEKPEQETPARYSVPLCFLYLEQN